MYILLKRIFDIFFSLFVLVAISPLLIPIIIALLITDEGEVFYFQKRIGHKNSPFYILKFATMLKNSPNMGAGAVTIKNDPRVTKVGKYLRKSKINELPQIINVLKGDMSLIGPRPVDDFAFNAYPAEIASTIYNVKPGISGIGSIVFRDEEKILSRPNIDPKEFYKKYIAPYKGSLEIWYQNHASLSTDLLICLLTVWQVIFPKSKFVYKIFKDLPPMPQELLEININTSLSKQPEKSALNN